MSRGTKTVINYDSLNEVYGVFEEYCLNRVFASTEVLVKELDKLCDETHYKPLILLTSVVKEYFNVSLGKTISNSITEWSKGKKSIKAYLKAINAGDVIIGEAAAFEKKLIRKTEQWYKLASNDVSETTLNMDRQYLEVISRAFNSYDNDLENMTNRTKRELLEKGQNENTLYNFIYVLFEIVSNAVRISFRDIIHDKYTDISLMYAEITEDFMKKEINCSEEANIIGRNTYIEYVSEYFDREIISH